MALPPAANSLVCQPLFHFYLFRCFCSCALGKRNSEQPTLEAALDLVQIDAIRHL
jgi:hypothetical protein